MSLKREIPFDFISISNKLIQSTNNNNSPSNINLMEQSVRSTHSVRTAKVKQRLIRMLIVIVIIFFCCWTPSYIWWLLLNAQDSFGVEFFFVFEAKLNNFNCGLNLLIKIVKNTLTLKAHL